MMLISSLPGAEFSIHGSFSLVLSGVTAARVTGRQIETRGNRVGLQKFTSSETEYEVLTMFHLFPSFSD